MSSLRSSVAFALALGALTLAGCECGGEGTADGGGMDGGDTRPDGATPDGETLPDGASCVALGGACAVDGDCCSGSCDSDVCVRSGCFGQGIPCTSDDECCFDMCVDGACAAPPICAPFGAACAAGSDCCSGNCADGTGAPCAGGAGCACAPSTGCSAAGDPCTSDAQCCNNLCSDGFCAMPGACRTAGEPCGEEGFNGSCCSTVCLAVGDDPVARCQFLGGCRVQDDLCTTDEQCCSGACREAGRTSDGRPIMRCANVGSCVPVGEICGGSGATSNCCPNGGGRMGCEPTGAGFSRCFGGGSNCVLAGDECEDGGDPCCGTPPGLVCTPGTPRGQICCLPDGEECAFGDLCCNGICAPGSDGVLRCGATCVADGGACNTDADCCNCCRDGVCTDECGSCTGPMLGELCDPDGEPCCDAPAVVCMGIEFPTCVLAP